MNTIFSNPQCLVAPRSFSRRATRRGLATYLAALIVLLPSRAPAGTLSFDGVNDYFYRYADVPETEATFECWIRTTTPTTGILEIRGGDGYDRNIYLQGGNLYARLWSDQTIATTGLNLADGQWHHIAHVFGASIGGQRLYVDSIQRASGTKTNSNFTAQDHFVIGYSRPAGFFAGEIDEVRFWSEARSRLELVQNMYRPLAGNEPTLVVYFPFEEGFGVDTVDASGHGKLAALVGGVVWNAASEALSLPIATPLPATGVAETAAQMNAMVGTNGVPATNVFQWGPGSTAVVFDGVNDLACVTNDAAFNTFPLTATAWVKVAPGTSGAILDKYWGGSWNGWQLWVSSGRLHGLYIRNNANYVYDGDWDHDAGPIDDDRWHHVAFSVGSGADGVRIYVDGVARVVTGWMGTPGPVTTAYGLKFGMDDRTPFRGQIDEITIWKTNLNETAIAALMDNPPATSNPDLLGYWDFEEGTGLRAADRSGHGRDAIFGGDPIWVAGARPVFTRQTAARAVTATNNVLDLDGMDDYVAAPPGVWFNGDLTIEGWVYPRDYRGWSRLVDFGNGAASDNVLLALTSGTSGQMYFQVFRGGSAQAISAPVQLPLRQWSHIAATLGSGWAQLYLNGAVIASGPVWSPLPPASGTRTLNYVGRSNWGADSYAHALFEDVRIWSAALPADILRNWMSRPVDAGHDYYTYLQANWGFDETSGDSVLDSSPRLRHAALVNGAKRLPLVSLSEPLTGLAPGSQYHFRNLTTSAEGTTTGGSSAFLTPGHGSGGAIHLDGVDDYVRVGGMSNSVPTGEVTVEFWQRLLSPVSQATFSLEPDPGPGSTRMMAHVPWGDGVVYWDFGTTRLTYVPSASLLGSWHHFAFVSSQQSGGSMRIYHNGKLVASRAGASAIGAANYSLILGAIQIPQQGYTYNLHGDLDEFRLWTMARSDTQISQNYNVRLSGSETGLTAYYRMDEGSGSVLLDATGRGNAGLLVNGPERIDSGATVGTPVPTANPATDVAYGQAVLNGSVNGSGDLPTRVWFEYGIAEEPFEGTGRNRADFYNLGYNLTTVNSVAWDAVPDWVSTYTNIYQVSQPGAFWPNGPGDYFAARYTGRVFLPEPGLYTFYLNSDDGSVMYVDGQLLINNDGAHSPREYSASKVFEAGYHPVDVRMFEQAGSATLAVSYSGPGIPRQVIPLEAFQDRLLYQHATAATEFTAAVGSQDAEATIGDLLAGTSYFYRVVAANDRGTNYSEPRTFMMPHPAAQTALQLDGVDDYVKCQPFSAFPSTNITAEFWMRLSDPAKANTPLSYAVSGRNEEFLIYDTRLFYIYVGNKSVLTDVSVTDSAWHHVAVTWSSLDGALNVYLDGTNSFATNNFAVGTQLASGGAFILGQEQDSLGGGFDATQAFAGELDEVRVWNVVRTEDEINETIYRSLQGNEPGLVFYYRFDEGSGTQAVDSSGDGHTGTLYNGPIYRPSTIPLFQPLVTTLPPTPVLATTATLRGTVNPGGATTTYFFEYGPTLAYGQSTSSLTLTHAGISAQPVSVVLTNLMPGTTYHYRLVARNRYGENYGADQSFTTLVLSAGWPISTKLTGGQASAPRHALDGLGNAYVAGLFSGSATFAKTLLPQTATGDANPAHTNAFIGKLARGADWIWATNIPVTGSLQIHAVAVVPEQAVYIAGEFRGTATFGTNTLTASTTNDLFVARLNGSGTAWLWAKQLGGTGPHVARTLALDSHGNVCLAGSFSGTVTAGTNTLTSLGGADILVAKLNANGDWLWATRAGGAALDESVAALAINSVDDLVVAGQFGNTGVAATFASGTFTKTLTPKGGADLFVAQVSAAGRWVLARRAGSAGNDVAAALEIDGADHAYLLGRFADVADYDGVLENLNTDGRENLFVAKLSTEASVLWYAQAGEGEPGSLALGDGVAYVTGHFSIATSFGSASPIGLVSAGNSDVFVAQLDTDSGAWTWAHAIGGTGAELGGSIGVEPSGSVVLSGSFQNTIQMGYVLLTSANERDIFVARLDAVPVYEHNTYVIGQPIPVPENAQDPSRGDGGAYRMPIIQLYQRYHTDTDELNAFVWSLAEHRLYAVRPVTAVIKWPLSTEVTNLTSVATCVARTVWPDDPQIHVAGTPVELKPAVAGFRYEFLNLSFTDIPGAAVDASTRQFVAPQPGWSVLQFLDTGGADFNLNIHPSVFEVVRTRSWNDPTILDDGVPAVIGEELTRPALAGRPGHNDPTGKRGYVFFEKAFYDGAGEDQAHKRSTRTGPIIPVNEDTASPNDDLVVVWYRTNFVTGIAWPDDPVRYRAQWPAQPPELVLASGLGSGELTADAYPGKRVYRQDNPNLPGYNPNEEHAALYGDILYALRHDLNTVIGVSKPYTLLKYRDPETDEWAIKVFAVVPTNATHQFVYPATAGQGLYLVPPLNYLGLCGHTNTWVAGPGFKDHEGRLYARAAGPGTGGTNIVARYWYPLLPEFFYDLDLNGTPEAAEGASIPWLDRRPGGTVGTPIGLTYQTHWPTAYGTLQIGDTRFNAKGGLPAIRNFASARIVYDQANPLETNVLNSLARIFDPLSERTVSLDAEFVLPPEIATVSVAGRLVFIDLPYVVRSRLFYDSLDKRLSFGGLLNEAIEYGGESNPLLLVNVMTPRERDLIRALSTDTPFREAVEKLYLLTRNPNQLDLDGNGVADQSLLIGLNWGLVTNPVTRAVTTNLVHEQLGDLDKAMTAALGTGFGFLTVAENDDPRLPGLPVLLHVVRVDDGPYLGDLKVLYPDNVFDERLTVRHSADFAGEPQRFEFEWFYKPDDTGVDSRDLPQVDASGNLLDLRGWIRFPGVTSGVNGANDVTLGDANMSSLLTISDNLVICRYRGYNIGTATNVWSEWAGVIGGGQARLAPGWVKRVLDGLNPFEARTADFHQSEAMTYASMIRQAGARYEGPIAFNPDADNLNSIGLIQAYGTVLDRGKNLSIDATPPVNFGPANNALMLAAGRIADFYMLLGNEAYADAADPTIGFRTDNLGYGTLAPCIFTFQNQLDSLLEEELCLLRGRDDRSATVLAPPVYNRLFWNFTKDQGEVAYAQSYAITDQNQDGFITADDAQKLYPQGHGDAWGHYLTAVTTYYDLLRNPSFDWERRTETIPLGNVDAEVDYLDERKFARAAAARAKTGAEIVDLTYRMSYVDDPAGQYQGYRDTDPDRAWGLSEWGHRAGQGAFFDWVTANALLPAQDPNPTNSGIFKIDRTTVLEIAEVASAFVSVQLQVDKADAGLNPLGLAKNVVPFDIDPALVSSGKTHFEQIYDRALRSMENAVAVFNHANSLSQSLRALQDTINQFTRNSQDRERDFKSRLIEVFGYPYAGDIGPGGTYPSGYDGPDLYHYMYVDTTELNGQTAAPSQSYTAFFAPLSQAGTEVGHYFPEDLSTLQSSTARTNVLTVNYPYSTADYGSTPPSTWGRRRAPGQVQVALSDLLQREAALKRALLNYDNLLAKIDDQLALLKARHDLDAERVRVRDVRTGVNAASEVVIVGAKIAQRVGASGASTSRRLADIASEGFPKVVGLASDVTSAGRVGVLLAGEAAAKPFEIAEAAGAVAEGVAEAAKKITESVTAEQLTAEGVDYELQQMVKVLEQLMREEAPLRLEIFTLDEAVNKAVGEYLARVAEGLRLVDERLAFRKATAGDTQAHRYQDMTFRVFRNDALQKYRAQFDLAARYVFLAAVAYDFETQLLGSSAGSGRDFLTDIIRQRSLGQFENGRPIAGRHGLADPLARLDQNFQVLKGQLGFNNPQTETGRFSLRNQLFRLRGASDAAWRAELRRHVVPDLWQIPEFRRNCRPFAPESAGPQPGLVIRFPTTVTFGLNYFGWPLGGGDSAYDSSLFATKVRSAGVWFANYNAGGLSFTPRVYLVPAGADILRSPSGRDLEIREWRVVDQKIPVPFPIGYAAMSDASWIPMNDSLSDVFADIRRFSSFRAYHDRGSFEPAEAVSDTRLIGRSVWNTDWMLIIPGGTFLYDPNLGLNTFINTVSDIKIFFQTYAYSGN